MKFIKKINNNVALAKDDDDIEWVLLGKGLGFGKTAGDQISNAQIDRRFKVTVDQQTHQDPPMMLANIDPSILQLAEVVSQKAAEALNISFSNYNYLALADHLSFALKRADQQADYPHDLRWEVKQLFPEEYKVAQMAVSLVKEQTGVELPESELTFLTYHFVSAQSDETLLADTVEITGMINRILEIISYHFQLILDTKSLNYARFLTHLRYFMTRQLKGEPGSEELDPIIGQVVKEKYHKAYQAAEKVALYLQQARDWQISESEKLYLTLHIWRLTRQDASDQQQNK